MFSSGGGTPSQRSKIRENEEQLLERRREAEKKDRQFLQSTDDFVKSVSRRTQEAIQRDELVQELSSARASHQRQLLRQQEHLEAEHKQAAHRHARSLDEEAHQHLEQLSAFVRCHAEGNPEAGGSDDDVEGDGNGDGEGAGIGGVPLRQVLRRLRSELSARVEETEEENRQLISWEERRAKRALEDLVAAQAEAQALTQERDSEVEAANVTKEAVLTEHRSAQRKRERIVAEVRSQTSETEALQDEHRGLEGKTRALRHELSKAVYTVGQRDQELKVKNSDLHEVRQSLTLIQDEVDELNRKLKEECHLVQRVEDSVRPSRDLGEKILAMREMVKESHSAMEQLCGKLEQERSKREQCAQGLRQQKVRTELLLQLLHHFKSRTQDLAPQALLRRNSIGGSAMAMPGVSSELMGGASSGLQQTALGGSYG